MEASSQDPTAPSPAMPPKMDYGSAAGAGAAQQQRAGGRLGDIPDEQHPTEALKNLGARFSELGEYVSYFLSAKVDSTKVTLRNLGIYAGLGVVALLAGGAFVCTLMVLLLRGVAGGLGALFGGRLWLGELVTAVVFLAVLTGGIVFGMKWLTKSSRERTAKKYVARQQEQRSKFGTDVSQRADHPGR